MVAQLEHLRSQKGQVEAEIRTLVEQEHTALLTIPGISYVTAGSILGELVEFHSTSGDPRALLAFAGLDPKLSQSGQSSVHSKIGKRGSPYLRNAIWGAAVRAAQLDPMFHAIYEHHRSLGKHGKVGFSHVAKKLTYVISSVLRTNRPYAPRMAVA